MNPETLRQLLGQIAAHEISPDFALEKLRDLPFEDLDFAKVDHHRALRQGFPEVVFGQGKTPDQIAQIARKIADSGATVLVTRAEIAAFEATQKLVPHARYETLSRLIVIDGEKPVLPGKAAVVCAGTSDLPVANEAAICLEAMGAQVVQISDVGVAGLHRILAQLPVLREVQAIIVVAGMEGALPSVVGGLVDVPVVAVPTSVGYGAAFGGVAALLGMLNTCASGVAVMNIDNGFGAAAFVASILRAQNALNAHSAP